MLRLEIRSEENDDDGRLCGLLSELTDCHVEFLSISYLMQIRF